MATQELTASIAGVLAAAIRVVERSISRVLRLHCQCDAGLISGIHGARYWIEDHRREKAHAAGAAAKARAARETPKCGAGAEPAAEATRV